MLADNEPMPIPLIPRRGVLVHRDGSIESKPQLFQSEVALTAVLNGKDARTFVCSPCNIKELVVGWLKTQGFIDSFDGIRSVKVDSSISTVEVDFSPSTQIGPMQAVNPIEWGPQAIFGMCDDFSLDSPAHRATYGIHSCYLYGPDGKLVCRYEDIGRHNAFDKVIGDGLINGIDLSQSTIFSSGRTPTDMALKAIRAGVPTLVTKAVPTNEAIDLARRYNLTLICSAHKDSMVVYNDPLGVVDAPRASDSALRVSFA